jgi:hypothetical protein
MNAPIKPGAIVLIASLGIAPTGCWQTYYTCVGHVRVAGENAKLDGKPARTGMKIRSGSVVTTGPDSSVLIDLAGGGTIQIDENTDPEFSLWLRGERVEHVDENQCEIRVERINGRVAGQTMKCAVTVSTEIGPLTFKPEGEFNLSVEGRVATLTTREGQANVERPTNVTLWARQQISARDARASSPTSPSRRDIDETFRWQTKYKFAELKMINGKAIYTHAP